MNNNFEKENINLPNFWNWNGFKVCWSVLGEDNKVPIIFLHGFGANRKHWRNNLDYFANKNFEAVSDNNGKFEVTLPGMDAGLTKYTIAVKEMEELSQQIRKDDLRIRIDRMIDWLVEKEMIVRTGESNAVIKRIQERTDIQDLEDDWEDEIPTWAAAATTLDGLEWNEPQYEQLPKRKGPAVFGFSTAAQIKNNYSLESEENPGMTYSATTFGETVSRLYLDPVSGYILRRGLRRAF